MTLIGKHSFGIILLFFITVSCKNETTNHLLQNKTTAPFAKPEEKYRKLIEQASLDLYRNDPAACDSLLEMVDSLALSDEGLGYYYLTKGLFHHKKGNTLEYIRYMTEATDMFSRQESEKGKADVNLATGVVMEDTGLKAEAAKSYFDALNYYNRNKQSLKYFYVLMGLVRTAPGKDVFYEKAEEYLNNNPNDYNTFYFLKTKAYINDDIHEKHRLFLQALESYDVIRDPREGINLYASLALDCQVMGNKDSANFYLGKANLIFKTGNVPVSRLLHYLLIKAYVNYSSGKPDKALAILDSVIANSKDQPAMLSQAYMRKAEINAFLKKYKPAYAELLRYILYRDEKFRDVQNSRLALLTIRYQIHQNQMELLRVKNRYLFLAISILIIFIVFAIYLIYLKNKAIREKHALKDLVSMTARERDEWQKRFELSGNKLHEYANKPPDEASGQHTINEKGIFHWEEFRIKFLFWHPMFVEHLFEKYPQLTSTDIKYCMCLSCGMTNQNTAQLLGVSNDAVKKAKRKLRKKFGLESVQFLTVHLNLFKKPSTGNQKTRITAPPEPNE